MIQTSEKVSNLQKEYTALTLMRLMLHDYAKDNNISFDEAFYKFATSRAYTALFDYETGLWKEGPIYLCEFWKSLK